MRADPLSSHSSHSSARTVIGLALAGSLLTSFPAGALAAGERQAELTADAASRTDEKEKISKEMLEVLEMLEVMDLLKDMDVYQAMDQIDEKAPEGRTKP